MASRSRHPNSHGTRSQHATPWIDDPMRRPEPGETIDRETDRWRGAGALALLAGALGVLSGQPGVLLAGVVGVATASYARATASPSVELSIERSLSESDPAPGAAVEVTTTVENTGERAIPDLRVIDGVPDGLVVSAGTPRHGTALRAGEEDSFSYTVRASRGEHEFVPADVLARDASGATERATRIEADTTLRCTPSLGSAGAIALRPQTTGHTGRVTTDVGGPGVEFHATREYRPGDSLSRIDWNARAKRGDLTTIDFREERAAVVVLLIDARESAYRAPDPESPPAVERAIAAAGSTLAGLDNGSDRIGISALAPESCWLAPGAGPTHRARARELLTTHSALGVDPPEDTYFPSVRFKRLRRRLPTDAQVVLFAPLADDHPGEVARRLDAAGHLVTVVSPDPTGDATPGQRLARVERQGRISGLRTAGIPVLDWGADEPLALAIARAGWGR